MKYALLTLAFMAGTTAAAPQPASNANQALPTAISCYQDATRAKDIDAYMACFTDDAVMVDVSRHFNGKPVIRRWALNEVISGGDSFSHKTILEQEPGYAKTLVNWAVWDAHYHYWWNAEGKITRMSLQYAD